MPVQGITFSCTQCGGVFLFILKSEHLSIISLKRLYVMAYCCCCCVQTYTEPAANYLHGQQVYTGHQQGVVVQQGGTVTTIVTSQTVQQVCKSCLSPDEGAVTLSLSFSLFLSYACFVFFKHSSSLVIIKTCKD